ncbi:hypothetical protein ACOI1H_21010 [Loktanella sp. DJP18]|uniref:hypothetical protein n=1 Tax=Loktanella sp. DJP18 TaxID=3409788 RepID=UPI003BB6B53A
MTCENGPSHKALVIINLKSYASIIAGEDEDPLHADERLSLANLSWICNAGMSGIESLPLDKICRWTGFIEGCLVARGLITPAHDNDDEVPDHPNDPVSNAAQKLFSRYLPMAKALQEIIHIDGRDITKVCERYVNKPGATFDMNLALGYVQGLVCMYGLTTVDTERDVSRPLFHEAYRLTESVIPERMER